MIRDDLEKIKKLVIIAMFSDDDLMDLLVLKGGNALALVYNIACRSSLDIDFSIEKDFGKELSKIQRKIEDSLRATFHPEGLEPFDIKFIEKPKIVSKEMADFWGGYYIEFKLIESEKFKEMQSNLENLRRSSIILGPAQKKKFRVDISKFEYCSGKEEKEMEGYTVFAYTPEMILFEKLRAICQQMPEYSDIVTEPTRRARARDFFDIYNILESFSIDMTESQNLEILKSIFEAKKVPLYLIGLISKYREYHRPDFEVVRNTVNPNHELKDHDYYFDYVVNKCELLKPLWDE